MTIESASIAAIVVGVAAALSALIYALVVALRVQARLRRVSGSAAAVAARQLPAQAERIAAGVQRLQAFGERWDVLVDRLTAARDASTRLQSGIDSVAACVIDLLETFAPSLRGTASE